MSATGVIDLETLHSIEKTAYDKGYAKGLKEGENKSDTEEYHKGMKDAWDIVRKIFDMNDYQRYAIFGSENSRYIMMNLPIGEVVEKLQDYESKKIKAGDEVIYNNTTVCIVLTHETDKKYASIVDGYGNHYFADHRELKKTGKHYECVEQALKEIGEKKIKSCSTCKYIHNILMCNICRGYNKWVQKDEEV